MALQGDTIRLEVDFFDFDNQPISPDNVTLNIYDSKEVALSSYPVPVENKTSPNKFYYDYTVPYQIGEVFIYEFFGIYNGKSILARDTVQVEFV